MALTSAERQRRYRTHKAGDHSLCDPTRCHVTTSPDGVTRNTPPGLGIIGLRLWRELGGDEASGAAWALALEACRISDRLAKLDRMLTGTAEDWVRLVEVRGNDEVVEVQIDKPLAEARQQAVALKQVLSELRQVQAAAQKPAQPPAESPKAVSGIADLTARIAARRQAQAAS